MNNPKYDKVTLEQLEEAYKEMQKSHGSYFVIQAWSSDNKKLFEEYLDMIQERILKEMKK